MASYVTTCKYFQPSFISLRCFSRKMRQTGVWTSVYRYTNTWLRDGKEKLIAMGKSLLSYFNDIKGRHFTTKMHYIHDDNIYVMFSQLSSL